MGIGLWFVYGVIKADVEIWLANGLSGIAALVLLGLKLHVSYVEMRTHHAVTPALSEMVELPVA